jgi:NADH:ubiquinone oxidoreductase subunit 3 (subunit A)
MVENSSIMGIVGAFIGIAIMLGIGTMILGNTTMDCTSLDGYNSGTPEDSTGWAATCLHSNSATQNAYSLLIVILIVVAAVAILFVVKML